MNATATVDDPVWMWQVVIVAESCQRKIGLRLVGVAFAGFGFGRSAVDVKPEAVCADTGGGGR